MNSLQQSQFANRLDKTLDNVHDILINIKLLKKIEHVAKFDKALNAAVDEIYSIILDIKVLVSDFKDEIAAEKKTLDSIETKLTGGKS